MPLFLLVPTANIRGQDQGDWMLRSYGWAVLLGIIFLHTILTNNWLLFLNLFRALLCNGDAVTLLQFLAHWNDASYRRVTKQYGSVLYARSNHLINQCFSTFLLQRNQRKCVSCSWNSMQ